MHADSLELRPLSDDDFDQAIALDELSFGLEPPSPELTQHYRETIDLSRGIGVFDGADLVGVGLIEGFGLTVPGGESLPMAGVLLIAVHPSYRRRGIMRRMIQHQLHGLHDAGAEPVTGLNASEGPIYGRFGYGLATYRVNLSVPRHRAFRRSVAGVEQVRVRLVPTDASVHLTEPVYARQLPTRPGMLSRAARWARAASADLEADRSGRSALRTLLAERDGTPVGYARFRAKNDGGDNGVPSGFVDVQEMFADDAAAHAALLDFLLNVDLTAGTRFERQPADGPLTQLLLDVRAAEPRVGDDLYLRLVDVDRALAGRRYQTPVELVVEVSDALCPWNDGRWQLTGDAKGAQCVRTEAAADLALDVRDLGAAYLGGRSLAALAAAGLVTELRPGAVRAASVAFGSDVAPWLSNAL
jgi:predicted acetyltransferase